MALQQQKAFEDTQGACKRWLKYLGSQSLRDGAPGHDLHIASAAKLQHQYNIASPFVDRCKPRVQAADILMSVQRANKAAMETRSVWVHLNRMELS